MKRLLVLLPFILGTSYGFNWSGIKASDVCFTDKFTITEYGSKDEIGHTRVYDNIYTNELKALGFIPMKIDETFTDKYKCRYALSATGYIRVYDYYTNLQETLYMYLVNAWKREDTVNTGYYHESIQGVGDSKKMDNYVITELNKQYREFLRDWKAAHQ